MSNVKAGSFTPAITGDLSINNLTFLPNKILFRAGATTGSTHTDKLLYCNGWTTANNQSYDYGFADGTHFRCQAGTDKCIRLYGWDTTVTPAAWKELLAATFVDFHESTVTPGNFGFTLNFTAFSNNQIRFVASD